MPSSEPSELPSVRAARQVRAQWAVDEQRRATARLPEEVVAAARAFDGWCDTLHRELGRVPTPDEQAKRFEQLACELDAAITRHQLADFWEMIPISPDGATLRLFLASPRANVHQHIRVLLNSNDPLAITGPLYHLPSQLRWWVEDYFALRRLPDSLTLAELQDWLSDRTLSAAGRERLVALRPEVGTLKLVLEEMGKTLLEFEFTPRGIDALVDQCLVRVCKGAREEYLTLTVAEVLQRLQKDLPEGGRKANGGDKSPPTVKKTKGKGIEARMLKLLSDKPHEVVRWSAAKWAAVLDCAESTVKETKTWTETLRVMKSYERAKRMTQKKTNRKRKNDR